MDYGYSTTSYGAQGGINGGGFMPGSQQESPGAKRTYDKETLRPVTIRQLLDAHHPHPNAEHFMIDDSETTQVTFIGQVRNISQQTTNVTYKVDDGTGTIEVKEWIDAEKFNNPDHPDNKKAKIEDQMYVRVWGRLKAFNNNRYLGAQVVRPVQDFNEIQYHLLEATAVHLHFIRGPPESLKARGGANGAANGSVQQNGYSGGSGLPAGLANVSASARRVFKCIRDTPGATEGMNLQDIAMREGMDVGEVRRAGQDLEGAGLVYTTVNDDTWAILEL